MKQPVKKSNPGPGDLRPNVYVDEATRKKIRKHLRDINDVITDQDIARVKIPGKDDLDQKAGTDPGKNSSE